MGEARRRRLAGEAPSHDAMKRLRALHAEIDADLDTAVRDEFDEYRKLLMPGLKFDTWIETLLTAAVVQAKAERQHKLAAEAKKTVQIEPYTPERAAEIAAA